MTNLVIYGYYYRFKQSRKSVKDLVTADNFETARTFLDSYIQQHDTYITNGNISVTDGSFTATDNLSLHHGSDHLDAVLEHQEDTIQKQATIDALEEV